MIAFSFLHSAVHEKNTKLIHLEFYQEVRIALLRSAPSKDGSQREPKTFHPISQRKSYGHFLVQTTQSRCAQCTGNARL